MSAIFGNEKLFACGAKVGQSQELLRKMKKLRSQKKSYSIEINGLTKEK